MTVRNAVAKAESTAVERAKAPTLAQVAEQTIQQHAEMLDAVLPPSTDRRRFAQMTIQAVRQAPDLARCFATRPGAASFLLAVGQAAMVNLEPNTPTQECWILPRKNGQTQEAQLTIGYRGLLKLARRSGTIKTIVAEVVREGDTFDYGYGHDGPYLEWKPGDGKGELSHAFAIAWTKDGGRQQIVLSRAQVEDRRAASDSWRSPKSRPYSPWTKWPEAMWRKSAIRALAPFLDLAPEAEATLHRDEQPVRYVDGSIEVPAYAELDQAPQDPPADVDPDGVIEATAETQPDPATESYPPGEEPFT